MAKSPIKERLLPSLLDRLTDDEPVKHSIDHVGSKINTLEKKLQSESQKLTPETRNELLDELKKQRVHYQYLMSTISSLEEIRDCVKRDLDWLFNTHNLSTSDDLEAYPEVRRSVINYGLPDMSGKTVTGVDSYLLESQIKEAILNFEPRLMADSLKVKLNPNLDEMDQNALVFEIESEMWSEPLPIHLHLRTEIELEDGTVNVTEY